MIPVAAYADLKRGLHVVVKLNGKEMDAANRDSITITPTNASKDFLGYGDWIDKVHWDDDCNYLIAMEKKCLS
jgi:hypothetical protein